MWRWDIVAKTDDDKFAPCRDYTHDPKDPKEAGEDLTDEQRDWLNTKGVRVTESSEAKMTVSTVEAASEALMTNYTFLTVEETDEIWYYKDGVYVPGGKILIAKESEKMFGYALNNNNLSQIWGHIMRRTYHKHEELDADINIINLKNGLYNIEKDVLMKHSRTHLSINQKPITYIKGAKPKLLGKFLSEVLYPREIRTAVDAMAYTLYRDYIIEGIFMLYGLGANGKTVYTSVLTAIHGSDNVSNIPLSEMLSDRFALSDLEHKDLNIDNELAGQTIKEAAVLKRLTGGSRQRIRIQRKREKAYDATLYSKLFFNANRMPESQDTSDAYNRRVTIISFPNRFEGKTEDKQLISKLTTDIEISGIFNVLMTALRKILKSKELYVNEKTIEERRAKYERAAYPIKSFIDEAIAEDSRVDDFIAKEDLYEAYVTYSKKHSHPMQKYDNFCKILKNQFDIQETRKEIDEQRVRCWSGITLAIEYKPKTEQMHLV